MAPAVWFLFDEQKRSSSDGLRSAFRAACKQLEWKFVERPARAIRDVEGRPLRVIKGRDLTELFQDSHRHVLGVVDSCDTRALQDPRDENGRISSQRTVRLERLLTYRSLWKESTAMLPAEAPGIIEELKELEEHAKGKAAADVDPRALAFLPFDLGRRCHDDLGLNTTAGAEAFEAEFGPPRSRKDSGQVDWRLDQRAYHGGQTLLLRGWALPTGLHWDVSVSRGSCLLRFASEVWQLKTKQYLNVYPDLYVRTSRDGGRKIWP